VNSQGARGRSWSPKTGREDQQREDRWLGMAVFGDNLWKNQLWVGALALTGPAVVQDDVSPAWDL
jgi:hypothetical protein